MTDAESGSDRRAPVLAASPRPPAECYDVALLDLDGVVYLGGEAIPGAADALKAACAAGIRLAYVTNNASRRPEEISALLTSMQVPATPADVVTSAQAAARVLRQRLSAGAKVLVVGTAALSAEVAEAGLRPVSVAAEQPQAVVQGYGRQVGWAELAEAMVALRSGAWWVATNLDLTLPSVRGPLPGNGALVGALRLATGLSPVAVGKPEVALHREAVRRSGARAPLVVGDRLDTDIEGAVRAGTDSLLVLTGVTTPADLLGAPPHLRPTYLADDLTGLLHPHPVTESEPHGLGRWRCGRFSAGRVASGLELAARPEQDRQDRTAAGAESAAEPVGGTPSGGPSGAPQGAGVGAPQRDGVGAPKGDGVSAAKPDAVGGPKGDTVDALRALCAAAWFAEGPPAAAARAADADAERALRLLGLA